MNEAGSCAAAASDDTLSFSGKPSIAHAGAYACCFWKGVMLMSKHWVYV